MTDSDRLPINQVHQSKEHTIDFEKQIQSYASNPSDKHANLLLKLSLIKRMYESKKYNVKKAILSEWPNQQLVKIISKHELISLRNNGYYIGEIANNVIHGKGIAIYSRERYYEGQFQNNYKHGQGMESLPTGLYIGSYVNNKPEGLGTFQAHQGDIYKGQFRAGMKHGKGIWISLKYSYEGEWKGNKPNGLGKIKSLQSEYQGMVTDGLKHGKGKQVFQNGDLYSGEYYNGRLQGYGVYIWKNTGATYKGNFKNGIRHGKGVWTQRGDTYVGEFSNDKKNGYGNLKWSSGNQYEGMFLQDTMHGEGEMKWIDGSWYKGNWLYGVQSGYGQTQEAGSTIKKGIFQNNVLILQEQFSSHAISKKIKLQRLYKRQKQQKNRSKEKQKPRYEARSRLIHNLQQFQTQSEYSKKMLPSSHSSFAFRSSKPSVKKRANTLKSQQMKSASLQPRLHRNSQSQSFSEGQDLRLIDWRRMRALKPM